MIFILSNFEGLINLLGNLVHDSLSIEGDNPGEGDSVELFDQFGSVLIPLIIKLHKNVSFLKLLKGVSDDLSGSLNMMVPSLSLSFLVSENGLKPSNSGLWLEE